MEKGSTVSAERTLRRREAGLLGGILLLTIAALGQVLSFPFVKYDDQFFVGPDTAMARGVSWEGLQYVVTHLHIYQYFPVTLISHMMDCQLFGQWAGGHHAVSLLLHLACTLLVFAVLKSGTGRPLRSAAVAGLFALHPLHVQAVVWVAERREVLCTFFSLLALIAYGRHVLKPSPGRYLAVTALFLLALLSKPMAVTLPFVFLLADVWPLARIAPPLSDVRPWWHVIREKLPWFGLSLLFTLGTMWAFHVQGALADGKVLPLYWRAVIALYAYGQYLAEAFIPAGLSVFYPYPLPPSPSTEGFAAISLLLLALLLGLGIRLRRRAPYLLVGILFFLGTLLPVSGLVQPAFLQSHADHYTYFALLGIFVPLVWGAADWAGQAPRRRRQVAWAAAVCAVFLAAASWHQARYWLSDKDLFEHCLALYPKGNAVAWSVLGTVDAKEGNLAAARDALERSLAADPGYPSTWVHLGQVASAEGDRRKAERCFRNAVVLTEGSAADSLYGLGRELALQGRYEEAIPLFVRAAQIQPWLTDAYIARASALRESGRPGEALAVLQSAATRDPKSWLLLANRGLTLEVLGRSPEAKASFEEALRLGAPRGDLAALMVGPPDPPRAFASWASELAEESLRVEPSNPVLWMTLARARCGLGQMAEADRSRARARELVRGDGHETVWQGLVKRFPPCAEEGRTP